MEKFSWVHFCSLTKNFSVWRQTNGLKSGSDPLCTEVVDHMAMGSMNPEHVM